VMDPNQNQSELRAQKNLESWQKNRQEQVVYECPDCGADFKRPTANCPKCFSHTTMVERIIIVVPAESLEEQLEKEARMEARKKGRRA
jgi:predicted ATP-dependent serine protease